MSTPRSILASLGACALLGCGSGEQTQPTQAADPQAFTQIDPTINVCPAFGGALVIPLDIGPNVLAQLVVHATDPDGNSAALAYDWSAPSGTFSDPNQPTTTYRCSAPGAQALQVRARDERDCYGSLILNVNCLDH